MKMLMRAERIRAEENGNHEAIRPHCQRAIPSAAFKT
jgi:hypothetical protein